MNDRTVNIDIDTRLNVPTLVTLAGMLIGGVAGYKDTTSDIAQNTLAITNLTSQVSKNTNELNSRTNFMTNEKVINERISIQLEQVIQTQEVIRSNQGSVRDKVDNLSNELLIIKQKLPEK